MIHLLKQFIKALQLRAVDCKKHKITTHKCIIKQLFSYNSIQEEGSSCVRFDENRIKMSLTPFQKSGFNQTSSLSFCCCKHIVLGE